MAERINNFTIFNPVIETVEEFLDRFELQLNVICNEPDQSKIEDKTKSAVLFNCLHYTQLREMQNKAKPRSLRSLKYEEVESMLKEAFDRKKSSIGATVIFTNRKRMQGENFEKYASELQGLASQCDFKACCLDRRLKDQFLVGLNSTETLKKLLVESQLTFRETVNKAKDLFQSQAEIEQWGMTHRPQNVYAVHQKPKKHSFNRSGQQRCHRCTGTNHTPDKCRFKDKKCYSCSKIGHTARACRSGTQGRDRQTNNDMRHIHRNGYNGQHRDVRAVQEFMDCENEEEVEVVRQVNSPPHWETARRRQPRVQTESRNEYVSTRNRYEGIDDLQAEDFPPLPNTYSTDDINSGRSNSSRKQFRGGKRRHTSVFSKQ